MEFDQVLANIRVDNFNWFNFYNLDIDPEIYFSTNYYQNHKYDTDETEQVIKTCFLDIEVWHDDKTKSFDFKTGEFPISAITVCVGHEYHAYMTLWDINSALIGVDGNMSAIDFQKKMKEIADQFMDYFKKNNYLTDEDSVQVNLFSDELSMIKACWGKIKQLAPAVLSGWNSDVFDFPYMYNRLLRLTDRKTTNSIMSELGFVSFRNGLIKIPEYSIFDLLHAYKPRAEGGLNYGKTRSSYSLDYISGIELDGLKKIEYKGEYGDLNSLFEKNPKEYLLYNIADVILCSKLNDKLKHIELHNGVRRRVKCSFSKAMIGSSALYENYVFHELSEKDKIIRNGMSQERRRSFDKDAFDSIPKPVLKKKQLAPAAINQREYSSIANKFDGAYVTKSSSRIFKGSQLIIDLDATSLYPSMMLQSNISFDSYCARIVPPTTYKMLSFMIDSVGTKPDVPSVLYQNVFELVDKFVEDNDISPKSKNKRNYYYIISYLIQTLFRNMIPMKNIFNPSNNVERILLQSYLIPLLDIMNTVHPDREAYNDFVYDYMFNGDMTKYKTVYIIQDISSSNSKITPMSSSEALEFISKYSTTMAGTCFTKHEDGLGLFTSFLQNMAASRKEYRKKAEQFDKDSVEFQFYNSRQLSIKVLMNSTYGVFGLSTYRYSNHWLAHSITTQGRTTIKLAQYLAEKHLSQQNHKDET